MSQPPYPPPYGAPGPDPGYGAPGPDPGYGQPSYGYSPQPQYPPQYQSPAAYPPPYQSSAPPQYQSSAPPQYQSSAPPQYQPQGYPPPYQPDPYQPEPYPPYQPPFQPPRRSNAGRVLLIVFAALILVCGGGAAVVFFVVKDDVKETAAASKIRLVAPETLNGRPRFTDPTLQSRAEQTESGIESSLSGTTSTIVAFYGELTSQNLVAIIGASKIITNPRQVFDEFISGMQRGGLQVTNLTEVDAGPFGGIAKCGDGQAAGVKLGVCVWVDRGSAAMITHYFKTATEARAEFLSIRGAVEQRS